MNAQNAVIEDSRKGQKNQGGGNNAADNGEHNWIRNEELSFILGLPAEVTRFILVYASRAEPQAELKLSSVCRSWRFLAFATPELWSRISIVFSDVTQIAEMFYRRRFLDYLERSGVRPLDIRFEIRTLRWSNRLAPMIADFLKIATTHSLRWRKLSLQAIPPRPPLGLHWDDASLITMLRRASAPNLKFLEVVLPGPYHLDDDDADFQPSFLRQVRMDPLSFMHCELPLTNITTLQLENHFGILPQMPFQLLLDLLNLTSSLVNFVIGSGVFEKIPKSYVLSTSIHRTSATKLKNFFCADQNIVKRLWLLVDAPCLELLIYRGIRLDVDFLGGSSDGETDSNAFPCLKTLAIIDCSFNKSVEDMLPFANATGGIIHLHIYKCRTYDYAKPSIFVPSFTRNNFTVRLWPELQTFACSLSESAEMMTENYYTYLKEMKLRSKALPTRCRLRLCRADADQWAAVDPQSWKALVKGRHYEELAVEPRRILEDGLGCFPWPLPSFEELLNYS